MGSSLSLKEWNLFLDNKNKLINIKGIVYLINKGL